MQKRNVLNSSRLLELKRQRKKIVLNKFLFVFIGLCVLFIASVYISRLSALNINNIEISGNQVVDTNAIKKVIYCIAALKKIRWRYGKRILHLIKKPISL